MVDGGPEGAPPVKRKRGRPRKADVLAAQAAAAAAAGDGGNGVIALVATAPSASPAVPAAAKPDPKPRKPRKKKGEVVGGVVGVDANLVGKTVTGVLDGSFDAGYLLTVRVGDSETFLRGVVFGPGLTAPVMKDNDVAPHAKHVKRDESIPLPPTPTSVLVAPPAALAVQSAGAAARVPSATLMATPAAAAAVVVATPAAVAAGANATPSAPAVATDVKPQQPQATAAAASTGSQAHSTPAAASFTAPTAVSTGA
ncbi:hypothetical protein Mapa_011831 [Marchantia paleacea]|nr:hypothetical protein Mapa_011831 [Marchantia paleacea]